MGGACSTGGAVVAVAADAAEAVGNEVGRGVRAVAREGGAAAGTALLEVAKALPWVAPIAVLIGAVVDAASTAKQLRDDAAAFARVTLHLEAVLVRARDLEQHRDVVGDIRERLRDALAFMQRLQQAPKLFGVSLTSRRDARVFSKLRGDIYEAIQVLTVAAGVDVNAMMQENFDQSRKLSSKIAELGGAEAVANDQAKFEELSAVLEGGESVMLHMAKATELTLSKSVREASEEHRVRTEALASQVNELTKMLGAVMGMSGGKALSSQEAAREALDDFEAERPMPDDEAARQVAASTVGLATEGDLLAMTGSEELDALVREAMDELGVPHIHVAALTSKEQSMIAGRTLNAQGENCSVAGLRIPRATSMCQHVIATGEEIVKHEWDLGRTPMTPEVIETLAESGDSAFQAFGATLAQFNPEDPQSLIGGGDAGFGITSGSMSRLVELTAGTSDNTYASVPVRVNGHAVASFCALDTQNREVDMGKLRTFAEKAEVLIRKRHAEVLEERPGSPDSPLDASHEFDAHINITGKLKPVRAPFGAVVWTAQSANALVSMACDPKRDVVVAFTAEWCGSCAEFKNHIHTLGERTRAAVNDMRIVSYDVDIEPVPSSLGVHVAHVPQLVLFPKTVRDGGGAGAAESVDRGSQPPPSARYSGAEMTADAVEAWLRDSCTGSFGARAGHFGGADVARAEATAGAAPAGGEAHSEHSAAAPSPAEPTQLAVVTSVNGDGDSGDSSAIVPVTPARVRLAWAAPPPAQALNVALADASHELGMMLKLLEAAARTGVVSSVESAVEVMGSALSAQVKMLSQCAESSAEGSAELHASLDAMRELLRRQRDALGAAGVGITAVAQRAEQYAGAVDKLLQLAAGAVEVRTVHGARTALPSFSTPRGAALPAVE